MGWSTFWATFKSTVDDRPELSSTQKLNYLRQAIKDPSLQLLLSSPLETTDTYDDVVQELKDRFQKTREIHRTIIKTLTSLSCPKHTRADLRLLYDVVKTSITNLKSTKQYDIESFLSSLIYAILPAKIQLLWDQATKKDKGVPPITQLLSFVKDHAETLPAAASTPTDKTPDPASKKSFFKKKDSPPAKGRNNVHVAAPAPAPYKWDCLLCAPEKHPLYVCPKWATYTITQRVAHINANHLCSNCLAGGHTTANCKSTYRCKECRQNHHTSIHQQQSTTPVNHSTATSHQVPDALMTTAQLLLIGPHGEELEARALIDSGAGISLVTQRVTQLLNLPLEPARLRLSVAQGETTKPLKHLTSLHLSPLHDRSIKMPCHPAVASAVTSNLPSQPVPPVTDLPHLMGLQLADPTYNVPGRIDILLGADMASTIITPDLPRQGKTSEPMAQSTKFGWTISGPVPGISHDKPTVSAYHQLPLIQTEPTTTSEPKLDTLLQAILQEQEGPEDKTAASTDTHQQVEDHYVSHTIYSSTEHRYEVTLPKKPCIQDLGESRKQAVSRFINNEKSILRKRIHPQFQEVIETYLELGHAEEVPPEDQPPTASFYLPMHAVFKESSSSTKLRVVFDGSAATTTGLSLNQSLLVGPTIQATLSTTLLKFRCYPVALNSDISKMYREVKLSAPDKDLHRFVWRKDPCSTIKDYRMTRVTFGVSASPFLAVRTLHQTAEDHGEEYPKATQHPKTSFYVDDFLGGADSPEEAIQLFHQIRQVLQKGGFQLRKWRSSSQKVLDQIPEDLLETNPLKASTAINTQTHSKALGLLWDSSLDVMSPAISSSAPATPTKRGLVSAIFKTYDVLGWISPTILKMKLLIQGLWKTGHGWDDAAPEEALQSHQEWREELPILAKKTLSRRYHRTGYVTLTLHGFADASQAAYGAVVYCRATYPDHPPTISLVASKTKLAKLDTQTIPRLELCAALLLARLLLAVGGTLDIPANRWHAWSDSSTVLAWLDGHQRQHPVYVANRVKQTLEITTPYIWHYVPTACNPADCASRGLSPTALYNHSLWWNGPPWLKEEPIPIPKQPPRKPLPDAGLPICAVQPHFSIAERISDLPHRYPHIIAITAWCRRLFTRLKQGKPSPDNRTRHLTGEERRLAETWLFRESQTRCFQKDFTSLHKARPLLRDSRIKALNPFLDEHGLLRVGGRLANSELAPSRSHPIIMESKDSLMVKLFTHLHLFLCHCGPSLLLCYTGSKLHILGARRLSRKICSSCITCRRHRPQVQQQLMGDLPTQRVTLHPAFTYTGMDYAGPFYIKLGRVRKPVKVEAYVCVFVCMTFKAIHLEVVSDLTTAAFKAALQRFVARRGCPQHLYSDNGANFIGATTSCTPSYRLSRTVETSNSFSRLRSTSLGTLSLLGHHTWVAYGNQQ